MEHFSDLRLHFDARGGGDVLINDFMGRHNYLLHVTGNKQYQIFSSFELLIIWHHQNS